ncbi:kinase-associated protein B [Falsibacillus pallidus]|uniref:Kinase-associated protein B n=1 Tax=Falsibacillus pallidus TaxID=493781 RepID=A0A370FZ72_9BACI|nr:kinase-associated protein B [Falsibacillus pallidus]
MTVKSGDKVTAIYKTGKYIGEVTAVNPTSIVIRILAVIKHPVQGDLHHPKQLGEGFFHERKALAYREQANIPAGMVKPFQESIPEYGESLIVAFNTLKAQLQEDHTPFAEHSLAALAEIQKEYELMYNLSF